MALMIARHQMIGLLQLHGDSSREKVGILDRAVKMATPSHR